MYDLFRRVRGILGSSLIWGAAWTLASFAVLAVLQVLGVLPVPFGLLTTMATGFGGLGLVAGAGFATWLTLRGPARDVDELRPWRFALGGALVAGVVVPTFAFGPALLMAGAPVSAALLGTTGVVSAAFGGATAYAAIKIAQAAPGRLEPGDPDPLGTLPR